MADGEAEKKSLLSKDVLDYIVGKKEALGGMTKAQMYERSLKRWWEDYSDRKNSEKEEHVCD